jgi:hypothetical protein
MPRDKLPYGNADGALTLDQILATAIDENELIEVDTLSDLQSGPKPAAGRVAEVGQSDIYLGDGAQWVAAEDVSFGSANNPIQDLEVVNATATGATSGFGGDPISIAQFDGLVMRWTPGTGVISGTSGSGSTTNNFAILKCSTGTTSTSDANAQVFGPELLPNGDSMSWNQSMTLSAPVTFGGSVSDGDSRFAIGDSNALSTGDAIGFQATSGSLFGYARDSGSLTTVELDASLTTGDYGLRVDYDGSTAEFYVDGTKQGELTSGFPTGSSPRRLIGLRASNTTATDVTISLRYAVVGVSP